MSNPIKKHTSSPKLLKLISVSFKEAALDSPSFRASVNHFNQQIDQVDHWFDALVKYIKKYSQIYLDFYNYSSTLITFLDPSFITNGLVDQDYTINSFKLTKEGLNKIWLSCLNVLNVNSIFPIDLIFEFNKNELVSYREIRKNFELIQSKYDLYLSRYASQSKTKDPQVLMEDAFQLCEVKKSYLRASLELSISITNIRSSLDKLIVNLTSKFWLKIFSMKNINFLVDDDSEFIHYQFKRLQAWSTSIDNSNKLLYNDMIISSKEIEDKAILQFSPSKELQDHDPSLLTPQNLTDNLREPIYEKHGWIFMKSLVGKPSRQIWIRKWGFIKNGIFGLLSLSPSKNFVQETDKIGVLLCTVRFCTEEDRRFCFEIRTTDNMTVIFQAESANDLKSWLKVFASEKKRCIMINQNKKDKANTALGRYPPSLFEFASTTTTSTDLLLTSSRIADINNPGNFFQSVSLSKLVDNYNTSKQIRNPNLNKPCLNIPITTRMCKQAIIAHSFLMPTIIPTAITANIWGSVNWGLYHLIDLTNNTLQSSNASTSQQSSNSKESSISYSSLSTTILKLNDTSSIYSGNNYLNNSNANALYPPFYPPYLKKFDIQLKTLFQSAVPKNDYVLLAFRCIWSPNSRQELSGRCFVTLDYLYFYMNSLCFISLLKKDLNSFIAVERSVDNTKDWDVISLYGETGLSLRSRIFLDDSLYIKNGLELLINNKTSERPLKLKEMIIELENIRAKCNAVRTFNTKRKLNLNFNSSISNVGSIKRYSSSSNKNATFIPSIINVPLNNAFKLKYLNLLKTDFRDELYQLLLGRSVPLPAKALMHVICGDNSTMLKDVLTLISSNFNFSNNRSYWQEFINNETSGIKIGTLKVVQTIEKFIENEYYCIGDHRSYSMLPFGDPMSIKGKIIIKKIDEDNSELLVYSKMDLLDRGIVSKSPFYYAIRDFIYPLAKNGEVNRYSRFIDRSISKIGTHGKINKAIKLYGQISRMSLDDSKKYLDQENINDYSIQKTDMLHLEFLLTIKIALNIITINLLNNIIKSSKFILGILCRLYELLSMNKFLLFLLAISGLLNLFSFVEIVNNYWDVRRSENFVNKYSKATNNFMNGDNSLMSLKSGELMQRAIYLKDMEQLVGSSIRGTLVDENGMEESRCFKRFERASYVLNYEKYTLDRQSFQQEYYEDLNALQVSEKYKNSLNEIAIRRNELVTNLRVLTKIEKELAISEWKNWLLSENSRCNTVQRMVENLVDLPEMGNVSEIFPGKEELLRYCSSCKLEQSYSHLL
ncbi:Sip3p ASCRUDRAFT_31398 [Ascoidea rubescens DSM 1968]|uniref:PH domain-containing protein n=1 Tax=Ascoidea rubescens DSM 1968 TaxID=1344418 RepID=A0A1D2VNH3_9ASCO|nr:hypothetical protein ASCRUDRAFT_31398 [Ascoidea rubescens DSM 1968]ODV63105.1 hypothetical protein ASCRUDRAFT_31398 [Ascoidea rubescens DSM 1968]